jgi:hypothetical protein
MTKRKECWKQQPTKILFMYVRERVRAAIMEWRENKNTEESVYLPTFSLWTVAVKTDPKALSGGFHLPLVLSTPIYYIYIHVCGGKNYI